MSLELHHAKIPSAKVKVIFRQGRSLMQEGTIKQTNQPIWAVFKTQEQWGDKGDMLRIFLKYQGNITNNEDMYVFMYPECHFYLILVGKWGLPLIPWNMDDDRQRIGKVHGAPYRMGPPSDVNVAL